MKTIVINNKQLQITAQEERAMRIIRTKKFVAKKADFLELTQGQYDSRKFRSILPHDPRIGISLERNWRGSFPQSKRANKFFRKNPLCQHAVIGNVRRINTILDKLEGGDFR